MPSCGYEPIDRKRTEKILSFGKKMWKFPKAYAILINTLCKSFYLEVMFMEYIEKRLEGDIKYSGVNVTVRRKLGGDVDASCGQLRRKMQTREEGLNRE